MHKDDTELQSVVGSGHRTGIRLLRSHFCARRRRVELAESVSILHAYKLSIGLFMLARHAAALVVAHDGSLGSVR